jgi:hypothetical protein
MFIKPSQQLQQPTTWIQPDLDHLQGCCCVKKYDLGAGSISFSRGSKPVFFQYVIGDSDLERVDEINGLGVQSLWITV